MKKTCLLLTVISVLVISCTKDFREIKDIREKENNITVAGNICSGNNWQLDNIFLNPSYNPDYAMYQNLVYDNKIYVFDYVEQKVLFYDGASWDSIPSQVPVSLTSTDSYTRNFGFTIGNKGYIGRYGCGGFWEYSFTSNTWTQKACFPGAGGTGPFVSSASTFSIGSKGYVVAGQMGSAIPTYSNATWEYDRIFNTWTQKASLPQIGRAYATGFTIGDKGYILNGTTRVGNSYVKLRDLLEYNPQQDTWTNKGLFPGVGRSYTSVFVIDGKAYAGGGSYQDFYKYNPVTNSWSQVADVPILKNTGLGFSLNSKGYVLFGSNNSNLTSMLKYNPLNCFGSSPL